ncbi:MAG: hypothetical protein AB8E15_08270 [Bdellovibrionales bacterium]
MKQSEFTMQLAKFGIEVCNTAHDVNNCLAILMGYAENLEYMLESGKIDQDELQNICDKIFYSIEKLNKESKHIASERRSEANSYQVRDFSDFFHRWLKIQSPVFKKYNMIWNMTDSVDFSISLNWTEVIQDFGVIFHEFMENISLDDTKKLEVSTSLSELGFHLKIHNSEVQFNPINFSDFLKAKTESSINEGNLILTFTCFSKEALAKSAA